MANNRKRSTRRGPGPNLMQMNQPKNQADTHQPPISENIGMEGGHSKPVLMEEDPNRTASQRGSLAQLEVEDISMQEEGGEEITLGELDLEGLEAACAK